MVLPWFAHSHSHSFHLILDTLQPPTANGAGEFWSYCRNSPPWCALQDHTTGRKKKLWGEFLFPKGHWLWLEPISPQAWEALHKRLTMWGFILWAPESSWKLIENAVTCTLLAGSGDPQSGLPSLSVCTSEAADVSSLQPHVEEEQTRASPELEFCLPVTLLPANAGD